MASFPNDEMPAKFCVIIINPELDYLKIQQDFAINHGHKLPSYVLLKVPLITNKSFKVEVVKSDGELFLVKGWEVFKEKFSLKYGDFLTFEFDGDSTFDLFIFNRTCTHIECPFGDEETESDSDDGFEIVPESEWKRLRSVARDEEGSTRKRSKTNVLRKRKTSRVMKLASDDSENNENDDRLNNNLEDGLCIGMSNTFTKKMRIYHTHRLKLPSQFAKDSGINAHSKIILEGVNGNKQEVNVVGKTSERYAFGSGWYDFLRNNRVVIGSTLSFKSVSSASKIIEVRVEKMATDKKKLFEYVKKTGGKYKIMVSRDHSRKNPAGDYNKNRKGKDIVTNQGGLRMRKKPVKISKSQERGNKLIRSTGNVWAFSVKLKYHHRNKLDIPKNFVNGTGLARKDEILLKVGSGGEWPVQIIHDRCFRYSMSTGWRNFLRDNEVFEGYTIAFKIVQKSDNRIETRVLKNGEKGKALFSLQGLGRPRRSSKSSANL